MLIQVRLKLYKKRYSIGNGLTIEENRKTGIAKFLGNHSERIRKEQEKTSLYTIKAGEKKVGDLELYRESVDSLNVTWIGIKSKERGKHYASTVMDWVVKTSTDNGISQITLEVPGDSPDARHIYEKHGFKVDGRLSTSTDDVWGGLTSMTRKNR